MIDHRRLQRALFVLQMDPARARSVFAGDERAIRALGLGAAELALLRAADPAALSADRADRRREQVLGNVASEFRLSLTRAERLGAAPGMLASFAAAPGGIDAVLDDGSLPLAFARHAFERARKAKDTTLAPLVELESALAIARRTLAAASAPGPDEIARSPRAHLVHLPAGTHAQAERLRRWIDADDASPAPRSAVVGPERETLLLLRERDPSPHRLATVTVELLAPEVAALLELAATPLSRAHRVDFARAHGASLEELESLIGDFVADGVLM